MGEDSVHQRRMEREAHLIDRRRAQRVQKGQRDQSLSDTHSEAERNGGVTLAAPAEGGGGAGPPAVEGGALEGGGGAGPLEPWPLLCLLAGAVFCKESSSVKTDGERELE